MASATTRKEAATIIRRILDTLPLPPRVEAYLSGYADALEGRRTPPAGP